MKYVINQYKIEVRVIDFSVLESKEKNVCSLPPRTTLQKAKNCK